MSEYINVHSLYLLTRAATENCICRSLGSGGKWGHKAAQTRFIKPHTPEWSTSYLDAGEIPFYSLLKII